MEYYDIAFSAEIELINLIKIISEYTGISSNQILEEEEFVDSISSEKILIGIELKSQNQGFKTWTAMTCLNYEFSKLNLVKLGIMIAKELKTDVAIEDPLWTGDPAIASMMIIYEEKKYSRAYFYQNEESIRTLKIYGEENNSISYVIQELEK
jgi:hypothetical protein